MSIDIPLTKGAVAIVDEEDYELVSKYKWHLNSMGYAVWRGMVDGKKKTIRMHRLINNTPDGKYTDHINRNRLDNRRCNLRTVTQKENMQNKERGKGYWYQKQNRNWVVEIYGSHRGCFSSEKDAAIFAELVYQGKADKKPKEIKTHCRHGHSLEDAYRYAWGTICKPCLSKRSKEYHGRKAKHIMDGNNDSKTR